MAADIVDLGFRVGTTDIDHAIKKFGLLDREFGKVERSGGLVSRAFASVGEAGQKSGGLVSRAFSEASRELDKTLRSVAKLIPALKVAASELSDFASKYQRMENLSSIDIHVNLDTKRAISGIAELKAIAKSTTISIDARINDRASGALASTTSAVYSLTAAVASGLAPLRAYSHELGQLAQNAKDAARALTGASNAAGRGIAGNVPRQSAPIGGDSALRKHGLAVYDVTQRYSGLAVQLIAVKSAMAVFTAAAAGAIPVLGQMAAAAGAVFGTALATANVAAMSKELSKLTETTGASAEGLQKWRLAARFEGVKAELKEFGDMTGVFTDLSSQMDKLGTASGKDFADALKAIGLNAKDIKNSDPSDALLKIGDAIAKSNMSTRDKTAFLGAISDDAAKLLPLLEKAGQKFNEISDYASKVGAIQSDAQLAAAKEANTQLSYFKVGLEGVQTQLAAVGNRVINTLGPNIKKLFVDAKGPIDDWALAVDIVLTKFKHDLDSTGSWSTAFARMFEGMYPTLYQFLSSAGEFGKGYGEAFVTPMLDALKRGYTGISEALGNAGGAESLGKGLGEAMLPVIKIVDTIVASIKLLINNWDALKAVAAVTPIGLVAANWDSVVAVFESVGNGIRGVGEAFGLLNPATTANASGVQIFVAALGALLVSGAASRLVLGAIGAAFSTLSFALAPLGAVLGIVATGLKAVALAAVANPIGALITVIAMGAALIFTNWSKVGEFFTGLWAGVKSSFSGLIDWWNNTTPKEKVLDIKAATIDVVREKYTQFVGWLNNTTPEQKILDIKTTAIDLAKTAAEGFKNWWDGSTLKEWASSIGVTNIDTAKEKASQFSAWWKETTLAEKALAIATPHIAVARIAAEGFFSWWDKSTLKEISPPIVLNTVEKARTNLVSFFLWWDGRTLTEKVADIKITALNVARSAAESFKGWWASWTLKEVVADVTYETLVWAWEKGKELSAWWNSWSLPVRNADVEYGMLEYAYDLGKRFANWWNNLTLKSIIPDIKMPELPSVFEWGRNIGKDLADGAAEGLNRATSHITAAEKTANKIPLVMRAALDTHSPSKITEAIGADTAAGLGLGIEKGEKKVKSAAEKTAQAAADAFKSIMEGLNKQLLSFTAGDEAARRYELTQQKIVGSNQDVVIATEAKIKAFEDERKKTEEAKATAESAAKAYADLISGLNGQVIALSQGDEAGRRFELTQQKITGANQDTAISLQNQIEALEAQKTIKEDLARVNAEALSLDAQMTALKSGGVAAMQAEEVRQSALNDLKEKGIGIESSLAQQYLTSKTAVEAKTKALAIEQDIQNNLRDIDWLSKEIEATQKGAAALADLNVERAISNALSEKNLTLESDQGRRVAETTRQLFAKNKQLEIGQSLYQLRTDNEWLRKEIDATLKGEEALKAFNIQKRISEELDRLGIATGTQAAAQVESMIRQQEGLKEKLSSIQGLRQPISQFFSDVLSNGKDAFKNLGDYVLNWLKKLIVEFATNKLMLSIGVDASGTGGLLGGIGDKITGIFSGIGKTITSAVTSIFGSGGLGGILGSVAGALSPIGLIAGAASLLKGLFKKDGNLVFSQGMQAGQQLTGQGGHNGQEHYRQTALGLIGATSGSNKIGREQGFVPEFHKMMDAMVQLDDMIAKTIPNSVGKIKDALAGLEVKGFSTAEMLKQRYATVLQSLPDELQKAMANGRDVMSMTGEEIVTRFQLLAQVAESGLIPSLQSLGLNLGATHESALAAGLGLVDLMGGIDKVKAANDFYYQNFFTDKQREAAALKAAKTDVDAFNKSLGLTGSAAIDTHAEFRKYVQSLDLTTEAGRKAYAEAMKYAQSIDAVADANKAATQAQNELIASLRGSLQGIRDSFKDSITRINEDLMSQEELQKKYMNEAQKWAEKLKTESDPAKIADISAKLNEAVGKVWGTMTDEQKAANADYLKNLLTAAQADAERGLKNAISQAQQMREAISTLQRPANEMSNAASKMMSAAAKMPTDINITVTSEGVDVDKLPKFAKGGITSGVSIAGEAGAEAVVPLPDGRSIPVSMKINNAATLSTAADTATKAATTTTTATTTKISDEALKAYKDAIKSAQDYAYELKYGSDALRERKLLEEGWTQQMVDNLRTIEKSNDAAKKAAEIKSSYESAMKAANDQLFALKNGEEALRRKTLAEEGWTEQMINNLLKIEDANKAAEKAAQIAEDYKAALKSAEDYAYQLQFGEEALRRRTLTEQGWTDAMINNLLKIEDANKAAEKAAQIKNDYDAAMKAAQDYAYELKYGSEALKRRTLLEQGWTEQMINNLFALEKANEEARKAAEANQNAIDAMNKQRESEIETYERLQAAAKSMRQTLDELFYNAELTLASPFERLEAARKKVDDLSAKAAHDPVSAEALSAAVTDALKLSREYNASSQAYVDDYKRMTGLLAQVAEKIEKMRDPRNNGSSGPLRLSNGMEFVPGMRDDGTWEWDGSHAAGLSYVPFDGYIAQLHRGEMVVPANAANALRNLNNMDQQISMTPNVIDARPVFNNRHTERDDAQKQELAELKEQLKKANDKLERLASAVESGNAQKVQADKRKLALAEETRDSIHSGNRIADRKQVARGLK